MREAKTTAELMAAADHERDFHVRNVAVAQGLVNTYKDELHAVELGNRPVAPGRIEELTAGLARAKALLAAELGELEKVAAERKRAGEAHAAQVSQ